MKSVLTLAAALLFSASSVCGQSHLIPENSVFSPTMDNQPGYLQIEMHVFAPAFDKDVLARVIVEPSFSEEFAVGVKESGGAYALFYYVAPQHLWDYAVLQLMKKGEITSSTDRKSTTADEIKKLESSLPPDPTAIKLAECELPIDSGTAQSLLSSWRTLLLQTHYDSKATLGVDGDSYHFSMNADHQELAGKVWSPPDQSDIGRLVNIVYLIKKACPTRDRALIGGLKGQVSELQQRLPQSTEDIGSKK